MTRLYWQIKFCIWIWYLIKFDLISKKTSIPLFVSLSLLFFFTFLVKFFILINFLPEYANLSISFLSHFDAYTEEYLPLFTDFRYFFFLSVWFICKLWSLATVFWLTFLWDAYSLYIWGEMFFYPIFIFLFYLIPWGRIWSNKKLLEYVRPSILIISVGGGLFYPNVKNAPQFDRKYKVPRKRFLQKKLIRYFFTTKQSRPKKYKEEKVSFIFSINLLN